MTRQPGVARHAEDLLGHPVVATAPLSGGDTCTATKLRLSDGTTAVMKTLAQAPAGFFPREAAGLRWLAEATADGGAPAPTVLAADEECLILSWVETAKASADAAFSFGAALARTHAAGAASFGDAAGDGFIARLPLPMRPCETWAEFYAVRRVLPYLKLARDRRAIGDAEARRVEAVVGRLTELLPVEPPARLHGDLWGGNVLWGQDGQAWLVDPAACGGHRELDLAMLSLFGLPHLPRMLEGYEEVAPLTDDWAERLGLHQLFPLLVHAALFGGGYGARAAAVAATYL